MLRRVEVVALVGSALAGLLFGFGLILTLVVLVLICGVRLIPWATQPLMPKGRARLKRGIALIVFVWAALGVSEAFIELSGLGSSASLGFALVSACILICTKVYLVFRWDTSNLLGRLRVELRSPLGDNSPIIAAVIVSVLAVTLGLGSKVLLGDGHAMSLLPAEATAMPPALPSVVTFLATVASLWFASVLVFDNLVAECSVAWSIALSSIALVLLEAPVAAPAWVFLAITCVAPVPVVAYARFRSVLWLPVLVALVASWGLR